MNYLSRDRDEPCGTSAYQAILLNREWEKVLSTFYRTNLTILRLVKMISLSTFMTYAF